MEKIDCAAFRQLLIEAQQAYRADPSYAIAVGKAARAIEAKRKRERSNKRMKG